MNPMGRLSIKLALAFIAVVLLSSAVIGLFFLNMYRDYAYDSKRASMERLAEGLSALAEEHGFSPEALTGAAEFGELAGLVPDARVWIADSDGNVSILSPVRHGRMGGQMMMNMSGSEIRAMIRSALSGEAVYSARSDAYYDEDMITVAIPVRQPDGSIAGAVLIHAPAAAVADVVDSAFDILIRAMLVAALLAALLGLFIARRVTRPLKALDDTARQMAMGNYDVRTGIRRSDEIGTLSASVDHLAASLSIAVDQLHQERSKLKDIIDSMSDGLAAYDSALCIIECNDKARALLQTGETYPDGAFLRGRADLGRLLEGIESVLENGAAVDGKLALNAAALAFTVSPVRDKQGRIAGAAALIRDISQSERLEQIRRDFVANVSHEFRTPLTLIKGYAEAVLDGAADRGKAMAFLERIVDETNGLERIVSDLLDLSRMQAGRLTLHPDMVDMIRLVSDTARSMQLLADQKGIRIDTTLETDLPPIWGDEGRIRQLLIILLDNAIKYSEAGTPIEVSAGMDAERVYLRVRDHGPGIPESEQAMIWERYYRSRPGIADDQAGKPGAGLGLAIARHIIDLHGGDVSIWSAPGKGTEITAWLPLKADTGSAPAYKGREEQ